MLNFEFSPDQDKPGNKQFITFSPNENYQLIGNTHGKLSHAIKHYEEFDVEGMNKILSDAMNFIINHEDIYLMSTSGKLLFEKEFVAEEITLNAVHNTFDLINDKIVNGITLLNPEKKIYEHHLISLEYKYEEIINQYLKDHIIIEEHTLEDIQDLHQSMKRIKFCGVYDSQEFTYILDFSNSGLLVLDSDGNVSTLFRIDKQGNDLNEIRGYFSRQVQIVNSHFRSFLLIF